MKNLIAPFPYFGGKSRVAGLVWSRLGRVDNYVEPFAGSLAVLLSNPSPIKTETINDLDGFVSNFWRAVKADPKAVACHAANPVNECDLHARHFWLLSQKSELADRLCGDPEWFDAKAAGWWAYGMSCWIGSGFCSGEGGWISVDGRMVRSGDQEATALGNTGQGVTKQLPHLGNAGQGVTKQLPHLGDAGRGVTKQLPHLGDVGQGGPFDPSDGLLDWMFRLADRLRTVRVCCGDWIRVCGPSVTFKHGLTGVFLDPPYGHDVRQVGLYTEDATDVTRDVESWCLENGTSPLMRIALCGYEGEYDLPAWFWLPWKAAGGYGSQGDGNGRENASKERIWFSPHCLKASLFEENYP